MSHFLVTGATGGSTAGATAPNRLEINDFVKQEDQFSLYIQALQSIYSGKSQSEIDSFFQIGAIHGLPYIPWDDAGKSPVDPGDPNAWEGYCTHGSVLFPTFHRPYVLLIEQVIQAAAVKIAATYTVDAARFQNAALNLRQPYWDWARNAVPPPEVISLDKVTITAPNGQRTPVDNPLRRYKFHPVDPSFPSPYAAYPTTLRYPTSTRSNATDNVNQLTRTLKSAQTQLRTKTYNLLTRVHTWPAFSNHTPDDGGSSSNSLEGIHDSVHVDVGGGNGHMSDPAVAAFDPIFFMHHCQVDRLLSLWSALNPGVWVTSGPSGEGTWTIPPNTSVDVNTKLTPFWNTQTSYWLSSNVTDTSKLSYSYPEFNNLDLGNQNAVRTAIANQINKLYGGPISALSSVQNLASLSTPESISAPMDKAQSPQIKSRGIAPSKGSPTNGGNHSENNVHVEVHRGPGEHPGGNDVWEWSARVHVKKYDVGGSFKVLFFLKDVPDSPAEWDSSPSFVGGFHAFVNSSAEQCSNCRRQHDVVLEGFVHLDDGLARLSGLNSFDPQVVEPYLKENLHWRVQKVSGEEVDIQNVESLEIVVIAARITLPPGAIFPEPVETHQHHSITRGRRGGSRQAA